MLEIIGARKGNVRLLGIAVEPEEPFVLVNQTLQLVARAKPKSANKGIITWGGGSSSTISVSNTGLITGIAAEKRVGISASSDAGFSTWVYARCGYDMTDVEFEDSSLTIEGIQGVLFGFTFTPSGATEISFMFESNKPDIADYYWQDSSSYANQRRMWGYSVGQAIVTAKGRSGNAQFPCVVTVTPVALQQVELRELPNINGTVVTEQGDSMPNIATYVYTMVGARGSIQVYFEPFNATQRKFMCEVDDESVATVEQFNGANTYYNRVYGTARYESVSVHAKNAGNTMLTVTPEHGDGAEIEIRCLSSITGTASYVGRSVSSDPPYGWLQLSCAHYSDCINSINFVSETEPNRDNSSYRVNGAKVALYKQVGNKAATWRGHWEITMDDGTTRSISNSASHYASASE